jgi:hypothetical protein
VSDLASATPLPYTCVCAYCSELAPLYQAVFTAPWSEPLEDRVCARCLSHLNDDYVEIPDHPLRRPA